MQQYCTDTACNPEMTCANSASVWQCFAGLRSASFCSGSAAQGLVLSLNVLNAKCASGRGRSLHRVVPETRNAKRAHNIAVAPALAPEGLRRAGILARVLHPTARLSGLQK